MALPSTALPVLPPSDSPSPAPPPPPTSFDPAAFRTYLLALLPAVFGASLDDLQDSLFDDEFDERVVRFAAEGGSVVYVVKVRQDYEGAVYLSILLMPAKPLVSR